MSSAIMNTNEAAAYIRKSASWLNKSRMNGTGPVYMKNGGTVVYALPDLDAWMSSNRRTAVYSFANDNQRVAATRAA